MAAVKKRERVDYTLRLTEDEAQWLYNHLDAVDSETGAGLWIELHDAGLRFTGTAE